MDRSSHVINLKEPWLWFSIIWISDVMHMNEWRQPYEKIWHTHEWVTVAIRKDKALSSLLHQCHLIYMSHTYECEYDIHMAHIWMWHTYDIHMAHIWMTRHRFKWLDRWCGSHVTHMNESYHTYEWVMSQAMSHMWMSHVTHMNESWRTYEWVMSHIWMSHVTHMNESCHTYEWVMSHIWMWHI